VVRMSGSLPLVTIKRAENANISPHCFNSLGICDGRSRAQPALIAEKDFRFVIPHSDLCRNRETRKRTVFALNVR